MASFREIALLEKTKHPEYSEISDALLVIELLPYHPEWQLDDFPCDPPPGMSVRERIFPERGSNVYVNRLKAWKEAQLLKLGFAAEAAIQNKQLQLRMKLLDEAIELGMDIEVLKLDQLNQSELRKLIALEREKSRLRIAEREAEVNLQARMDRDKARHRLEMEELDATTAARTEKSYRQVLLDEMEDFREKLIKVDQAIAALDRKARWTPEDQLRHKRLVEERNRFQAQYDERDSRLHPQKKHR